ncbi:MAG: glycosyl hydrolase [Vicinamibacterales bacterium]
MMKRWRSGVVLVASSAAFVALAAAPRLGAEAVTQSGQAALVDPALLGSMQYRHLSVFSRGGRSTAVVGVPSSPETFYAGYTGGGVWRTTDNGQNWVNLSDGFFEAGSIGAIDVALSDPNIIYVGTGSACPRGNVSPGVGMYKSSDAGKTWQHVGLRGSGTIGRVRIHPTNPNIAYVAVLGNMFAPSDERGVYRTRDGGATWEKVHFISNRTGAVDITMDPKDPNVLIAAMWTTERKPWTIESGSTEGGMFRTTDGGNTWTKLGGGLPDKVMVGRIGVDISPANGQRVYAQVEAADDQGGVFISNDGGLTWTRGFTGRALQQRAWYYTHIVADPVDVDTVYGLNVGAFKSTDGGKTFGSAGIQSHSDYHDLWINPSNNKVMVVANDGGAAVSTGEGWSGQDNQPTAEMYRVSVDNRYPYWVYGGQQDNSTIGVPSQGNDEPYSMGGGESGYVAVDPRNANVNYAGNYGGTLQRLDREKGLSENVRVYADSQTGQRAADMKYRFQWNNPIKISWHTPDVVYTTSQVVHRTTDGGANWDVISPDLTRNDKRRQQYSGGEGITRDNTGVEVYATIFAFEESPTTQGLFWAGSDDGLVHISRDNGKTWTNVTPADWPEGTINTIDPSDHDPGRAFVVMHRYRMGDFTPYIWRTDDYGKSWTRIADGTNGIPNWHFTRAIQEDPKQKGLLYAGTEFGMYVSFNDGRTWQPFQNNLPITPITDLQVFRNDLVVATQGRGFWIMDNLAPMQGMARAAQAAAAGTAPAALLFKPEDSYRQGGRLPTIQYWFKDKPSAPVKVEVKDASGTVVWTAEGQPADRPAPAAAGATPGGRGGRGGARGGGGGRGGGRGGFGGGGGITAYQGLNTATWNPRLPAMFQVPQGIVGWGIGGGQGPKVRPGVYTVTVSSGTWSSSESFTLNPDPRWPRATDAQYDEQFKTTVAIGEMTKRLWDELAKIRDVKSQLQAHIKSAGAGSAAGKAAQALHDKLFANESILTQVQGEGGQDGLNYPGRLDNQWSVLYSNAASSERWPMKGITERYNDLMPETTALLKAIETNLTTDVAAYNKIATSAKLSPIVVK